MSDTGPINEPVDFRLRDSLVAGDDELSGDAVKSRSNLALGAFAFATGMVAAWPPLHLVLVNANLATYYPANIGNRFFWTLRFVENVPGDFVHPGQGVVLPLIQALYYLAGKLLGLDLFGQINLFGLLTIAVPAMAMVALSLAIAFDRQMDTSLRVALLAVPLVIAFGGPQLFAYLPYPDYFPYSKFFFLLFGWRWLHHRSWAGIATPYAAIELGILAGFLAALKVNYVVWPAGLLLGSLIATVPNWRAVLRAAVLVGLSAALVTVGAFLLHYRGSLSEIVQFFRFVTNWGTALTGSPDFTLSLFPETNVTRVGGPPAGDPHASEATLAWLLVIFAALACLPFSRFRIKPAAIALTIVALTVIAVRMAYVRGGGSSYFDAVVMVSILTVMITAVLDRRNVARFAQIALAVIFVAWPTAWILSNWRAYASVTVTGHEPLTKLGEAGDWQRKLHTWNLSHGLPIYVLTPTNYYTKGTIEDMMMLGFRNFAIHAELANRNPALLAFYPQFHFLFFSDVAPQPSYHMSLPPQRVIFMQMLGKPSLDFPQLDQMTLDQHAREVDDLLRGRRRDQCYTVRHILTGVDIKSCVMSAPE